MVSGGPAQTAISPTTAAGFPPMSTVGTHGPEMGPPTWGGGGDPGLNMGQVWLSPIKAAGIPIVETPFLNVWGDQGFLPPLAPPYKGGVKEFIKLFPKLLCLNLETLFGIRRDPFLRFV